MQKLPTCPTRRDRRAATLLLSGVVVLGLLAVGCGGDGSTKNAGGTTVPSSGGSTSAPPPTTSPLSAPPTTNAALAAKAAAAVLQPSDFPAGFDPQPEDPKGGLHLERIWHELTGCLAVDTTVPPPVVATSPTFLRGLATQGRAAVEYLADPTSGALAAALAGPAYQGCLVKAFNFNAQLSHPEGATPGPATVKPLGVPQVGQKMFASRVNVTQNLGDLPININHDYYIIFNGGAVIQMWFLNPGSGFPPTLEQSLVQAVVKRTT